VVVYSIEDSSPAKDILNMGDVILEIDKKVIKNIEDFNIVKMQLEYKKSILFRVLRNGKKRFEVVRL
jgi:S1-C subfamily serine protease